MAPWRRVHPASFMPEMADMPDIQAQYRIMLRYEAMYGVIGAMLDAARIEDWDALARLEAECAAQVTA